MNEGHLPPWALELAETFAIAVAPLIVGGIYMNLRAFLVKRGLRTDVLDALARGAAQGYLLLAQKRLTITDPTAEKLAIEAGMTYANKLIPEKMVAYGTTPDKAHEIIKAELGKLAAQDSGITIAGGSTATATAGPGETATATAGGKGE